MSRSYNKLLYTFAPCEHIIINLELVTCFFYNKNSTYYKKKLKIHLSDAKVKGANAPSYYRKAKNKAYRKKIKLEIMKNLSANEFDVVLNTYKRNVNYDYF